MQKISTVLFVFLFFISIVVSAQTYYDWEISTTFGPQGESAQYCAVDGNGRLWVTDYGAPGTAQILVFNSDGTQADFSPVLTGLDETGASVDLAGKQLGGVAYP